MESVDSRFTFIIIFFPIFQLYYCSTKTVTIMLHNYILEKSGSNGKPKRDAEPANIDITLLKLMLNQSLYHTIRYFETKH